MENEQGWPPKDTPRTNAAAVEINRPNPEGCDQLDWPSFSRRLERENGKLRASLDRSLTAINAGFGKAQRDHIIAEGRKLLA